MITKDQIEAAARDRATRLYVKGMENAVPFALCVNDFTDGALWMQAEMEKLIEQRERVVWEAARMVTLKGDAYELEAGMFMKICGCITKCEFVDETFEDWKNKKETK